MTNPNDTNQETKSHYTGKLRNYIWKQMEKQMGKEEFNNLHYLMRDLAMENYEMEHQEELEKMFPGQSL